MKENQNNIKNKPLISLNDIEENSLSIAKFILCPICKKIDYNLIKTKCEDYFCENCFKNSINKELYCPNHPDKKIEKAEKDNIENLYLKIRGIIKVYCKNKDKGCNDILLIDNLNNHLNKECLFRMVKCDFCNLEFFYKDIQSHQINCSKIFIKCNCGKEIEKYKIEEHKEIECPNTIINCYLFNLGCNNSFFRKDLKKHNEENRDFHFSLFYTHFKEFTKIEKDLSNRIEKIENFIKKFQNENIENFQIKFEQIEEKYNLIDKKFNEKIYSIFDNINLLKGQIDCVQKTINNLLNNKEIEKEVVFENKNENEYLNKKRKDDFSIFDNEYLNNMTNYYNEHNQINNNKDTNNTNYINDTNKNNNDTNNTNNTNYTNSTNNNNNNINNNINNDTNNNNNYLIFSQISKKTKNNNNNISKYNTNKKITSPKKEKSNNNNNLIYSPIKEKSNNNSNKKITSSKKEKSNNNNMIYSPRKEKSKRNMIIFSPRREILNNNIINLIEKKEKSNIMKIDNLKFSLTENSSSSKNQNQDNEIEKIEILNDNSSEEENIFDKNYLLDNLLVLNYSTIKSKEQNLYDHQFVLGNYALNKKTKYKFQYIIKLKKEDFSWIAVGLGDKELIESNNFIFALKKNNINNLNNDKYDKDFQNGFYGISINGKIWNMNNKNQNEKSFCEIEQINKREKIFVYFEYDLTEKKLNFICNNLFNGIINNVIPIKSKFLTFCIVFFSGGDEVELIFNQK